MGDVMQEVIDSVLKGYLEILGDCFVLQLKVEMVGGESWKEGDDFVVDVIYENLFMILEVDFLGVELECLVVLVSDEQVIEVLENLVKNVQFFEDCKKGIKFKDGDQVVIDFKGMVDGEVFEGGIVEDYLLVLGLGSFIFGFEEQLIGVKVGDEVKVEVKFFEDYGYFVLVGKDVVFEIMVKVVKVLKVVELDDELVKKFGVDDLDVLKGQICECLEVEYKGVLCQILKCVLLDKLDVLVSFELLEVLVEVEVGQIVYQFYYEEYFEDYGYNYGEIELIDEYKKLVECCVCFGLLLVEIGQKNEIIVLDQEMIQVVMNQVCQYLGQECVFFEFIQQNL